MDLILAFDKSNPEIGQLTSKVLKRDPFLSLSQTDDPTVGTHSHCVAIEVKSPDGSFYGSSLQLATWLAAGLEKMNLLLESASEALGRKKQKDQKSNSPLPFIGIAVIGHTWNLHVASKADNGDVVSSSYRIWKIFLISKPSLIRRVDSVGTDQYGRHSHLGRSPENT